MIINTANPSEVEVCLDEVFDFKKVEEFRKSYEALDCSKLKLFKISFASTKYMDSSALGMLLNVQGHFKDKDVKIKITNTKGQIKKILSISRFDKRFDIE